MKKTKKMRERRVIKIYVAWFRKLMLNDHDLFGVRYFECY